MASERVIKIHVWREPRECGHDWCTHDGQERISHLRDRSQAVAWGKESALGNMDASDIPDVIRFVVIDGPPPEGK